LGGKEYLGGRGDFIENDKSVLPNSRSVNSVHTIGKKNDGKRFLQQKTRESLGPKGGKLLSLRLAKKRLIEGETESGQQNLLLEGATQQRSIGKEREITLFQRERKKKSAINALQGKIRRNVKKKSPWVKGKASASVSPVGNGDKRAGKIGRNRGNQHRSNLEVQKQEGASQCMITP